MSQVVSVSNAQYRMLGRAIRGERLSVRRFRPEHATARALQSKKLWVSQHGHWVATDLGHKVHAGRGIWRPYREVWDSAPSPEREAFRRVITRNTWNVSPEEEALAFKLRDRMKQNGEIRDEEPAS